MSRPVSTLLPKPVKPWTVPIKNKAHQNSVLQTEGVLQRYVIHCLLRPLLEHVGCDGREQVLAGHLTALQTARFASKRKLHTFAISEGVCVRKVEFLGKRSLLQGAFAIRASEMFHNTSAIQLLVVVAGVAAAWCLLLAYF